MPDYRGSDLFSELEKLVMDYAVEMTRAPVDVPGELFEALRRRFDEPQLVELTYAIGWENFLARTAHALEIEPAGFSEGAACAVPYRSSESDSR